MSVLSAVKSGSRRDTLIAMRDCLAERLDNTESGRDSAALSKRLMEVFDELDELDARDSIDDGWGAVIDGIAG